MKVLINLVTDSDNSYPEDNSLMLEGNGKWVKLRLTSPDREITILRKDLEQAVGALT